MINFLVIAFVIFLLVRALEQAKKKLARKEAIIAGDAPDPVLASQEQLTEAINNLNQSIRSKGD